MSRDDLKRMLGRAVRDGAITQADADRILASFDAGTLDLSSLPPELQPDDDGGVSPLLVGALAVLLLSRTQASSARGWIYDVEARRYTPPAPVRGLAVRPTGPGASPQASAAAVAPVAASRPLTPEQVRRIVDTVIDRLEPELLSAGARLTAQRINLADWYAQMEDMIADRFVAMAVAARGGFAQVTEADRLWIRDQIVGQFEALDRFADDIRRGRYGRPPSGGIYEQRIRQYAQASRQVYEDMRGRVAEAAGFDMEQWFLGAADACPTTTRMGCVERARKGRVPINSVPGQGRCTCLHNCRCVRRLFKSDGGRAAT